MKKRLFALFLAASFAITGCDFSNPDPLGPLPDPSYFQKEGTNITKFEWLNVPEEGILRGCFDECNIALKIYYDDETTETIPLKMKDIPRQYRHILDEVGDHILTILFRGQELVTHFKILPSDKQFEVNYYDYKGNIVAHFDVDPGEKITVPGQVDRDEDIDFIYHWKSWEQDLNDEEIDWDAEVYPVYESEFKRSCGTTSRFSYYTGDHQVLHTDKNTDTGFSVTYIHLGRITNAPLYVAKLHENSDLSDVGKDSYHHEGGADKTLYAEFNINTATLSSELSTFFNNDTYYTNDYSSGMLNPFYGDVNPAFISPAQYMYKGKTEDDLPYNQLIGGVTKSVLDYGNGKTEVVDLFNTYVEDAIDDLLEDKGATSGTFSEPFVITKNSDVGYYRAVYTADVDVTLAIKARMDDGKLYLDNAPVYHPDVYFTVDPVRSRVKLDFYKTDDTFPATSGRKLNYDYSGLAGDTYYGVFGA